MIGTTLVLSLAVGLLSSLQTPMYRASTQVLLTPNDPTQQLNPTGGNGVGTDRDGYVAGQIGIVKTEAVAKEAAKSLPGGTAGEIERRLTVRQVGLSKILTISITNPDPARARDMADAVARGYIENRRLAAVAGLQRAADDVQARLGPLQDQIGQLDAKIGATPAVPGATASLVAPARPESVLGQPTGLGLESPTPGAGGLPTTQEALKAARYAAAVQYETLYSRQQELLVDISLKRGDAELIAEARTPGAPVSPRPRRDAATAALAGLLLGAGFALLREHLNDRVRSPQDVQRLTGLPLLALLPYDDEVDKEDRVVADQRPGSPLSEALRSLRTSIQYLGVDEPVRVIVVTSAAPNEGKSLVATNLAALYAQADYRTVLISADLRRSSINEVFGHLGDSPGLAGVISPATLNGWKAEGAGNNGLAVAIENRTQSALLDTPVENLRLLPSGATPPNPSELLGSRRMTAVLGELSAVADIIIIDTPPLLPVTDAAVLASKADGVVLVSAMNETRRDGLERAKSILDSTGARVLGVVVNKAPRSDRASSYHYYYSADHGADDKRGRKKQRRRSASHGPTASS